MAREAKALVLAVPEDSFDVVVADRSSLFKVPCS
jgi:hypothetical protein